MVIALAADHGGFELKLKVRDYLESRGYDIIDLGTHSEESVDYPQFGKRCAMTVVSGEAEKGIVICGTGIGVSIAANKVSGCRCALCTNTFMAEMAAKHNNANVLALGARVLKEKEAIAIVDTWLSAEFEGGRHERRVGQLDEIC